MPSPSKSKNIVLIGAGNLATHLGKKLVEKGYKISQVYSRTNTSAAALGKLLQAEPVSDLKKIDTNALFYFICLKDDVIQEIAQNFPAVHGIAVHTSGSAPLEILSTVFNHSGVFYPIQTFNKNIPEIDFKSVPVCVEGSDLFSLDSIMGLARQLSDDVREVSSGQRKVIHLSAVFACNFVNYLYGISDDLLKGENLDLSILHPLIEQTAGKIKSSDPASVQTGPAVRNDITTIGNHLKLLDKHPGYKQIYNLLTQNILYSHRKPTNDGSKF